MVPEIANFGVGTSLLWSWIRRNQGLGSLAKSYFSGGRFCKRFCFFSAGLRAWDRPNLIEALQGAGDLTVQAGFIRLRMSGAVSAGGWGAEMGGHLRVEYTWGAEPIPCKLLILFIKSAVTHLSPKISLDEFQIVYYIDPLCGD